MPLAVLDAAPKRGLCGYVAGAGYRSLMRSLLDLVAPVTCVACGRAADGDLCAACATNVTVIGAPACERCGSDRSLEGACCADLGGFDRARSLVAFAEPARALTLAVKRRGRRGTARGIGTLMAELARAAGLYTGAEVVTFVPGGRSSRARGFDHAELLARETARTLGARVRPMLARVAEGPRQADVPLTERRANVADRFSAKATQRRVLLVDDVFTTGATVEACSTALRKAGAPSVNAVTWARTVRRRGISAAR